MLSAQDRARLRDSRVSVAVAVTLAVIGLLRLITDSLHEYNHDYWVPLIGTPLRYLVRSSSDGTLFGRLNTQWFKLLSVPTAMALWWLVIRFGSGSWEDMAEQARDPTIRAVWVGCCVAGFTLIELEKQFHMLGMATNLLEGESSLLNHVAHGVSAVLAWWMLDRLRFGPLRRFEVELERELDELTPGGAKPASSSG